MSKKFYEDMGVLAYVGAVLLIGAFYLSGLVG